MTYESTPLQFWEIDEYIKLRFDTFAASDGSLSAAFWPGGYNQSIHMFLRRGAAQWEVNPMPPINAQQEQPSSLPDVSLNVEGGNMLALNTFRTMQADCHQRIMEKQPHVYLGIMVVKPGYQGLGVESFAMKWGVDLADRLGLPIYVEATLPGRRLYERWGFEVQETMPFDARVFGAPSKAEHYCMVRPARKADESAI
ncbi:hypothetical protein D6D12_08540 [Aureobasidium pullulans]|uniref:N-acetyltransferase domain-containing protein n=1 Tax=Aureobasidium pullulans TaxID=5580 RepID=A0AB74JI75_AURPU|nr:hypothetical protein D6D12_08540 [Aureobasidium pullulans]THX38811.1 hypothetical protein D6D11_08972 [Aureobasidium pullulans]